MPEATSSTQQEEVAASGFGVVDEKGRVSLPKPVRQMLGIQAGSSFAYALLDHALLLIPQDEHLAALQEDALQALAASGLTAQDFLGDLPVARAEVVGEAYSTAFLAELERLRASQLADEAPRAPEA